MKAPPYGAERLGYNLSMIGLSSSLSMTNHEYDYLIDEILYETQLSNLNILDGDTDVIISYYIYIPSYISSYTTAYGPRAVTDFVYMNELLADIAQLDSQLDIDFSRTYDPGSFQISFVQVDRLISNIVGYASTTSEYNPESIEIVALMTGDASFDYGTLIHELGHALGLSHPYDFGSHPMFSTDDTIMSYNPGKLGWGVSFTETDISVLQALWGIEDSPDNTVRQTGSNNSDIIYGYDGSDYADMITGMNGDDFIYGYKGADYLEGGDGTDEIRGGNGKDTIVGGSGSDQCYGGFGLNLFEDELDGSTDTLFIKSDMWAINPHLGTAGNNPDGKKADILTELDPDDRIIIQGVSTNSISLSEVTYINDMGVILDSIGIYADGALEAIYIGSNLNINELTLMTTGIA